MPSRKTAMFCLERRLCLLVCWAEVSVLDLLVCESQPSKLFGNQGQPRKAGMRARLASATGQKREQLIFFKFVKMTVSWTARPLYITDVTAELSVDLRLVS